MVWHQAERYHVPRILFVNKMDRLGASFENVIEEVRGKLGVTPVVLNFPVGSSESFDGVVDVLRGVWLRWNESDQGATWGEEDVPAAERPRLEAFRQELIDAVASADDAILESYLAGEDLEAARLAAALRPLVLERRRFPVFSGASLRNQGIQPLLNGVVAYLPEPDEVPAAVAVRPDSGETVVRPPDPAAPFLGFVFKTHTDRERGRDSFVRIYSGTLREGMSLTGPRIKGYERVARLFRVHADKRRAIKEAFAGDIVLVSGLRQAVTADTLCEGEALQLAGVTFPQPVVSASLEARSAGDEEKIQIALAKLANDDPTFAVKQDEDTGQTVISGMGELHLEVLEQRLIREFGLKIRIGKPQVTYRETITAVVEADGLYDHFTAGRQHFASVRIRFAPQPRGAGFGFVNALPDERIPAAMIAMVQRALRDCTEGGILYGYPVVDLQATLLDGQWSEAHSTDFAYRVAAQNAFRDGCRRAGPTLLEPIMSLEIVTPREFTGGILSNLAARHGRVVGTETREQIQILRAEAPLSNMFGYATDLRSASQGRATYSMIFSHYDLVAGREGSPA